MGLISESFLGVAQSIHSNAERDTQDVNRRCWGEFHKKATFSNNILDADSTYQLCKNIEHLSQLRSRSV